MRLLIYGARSFAATATELAEDCGHDVVGCFDDFGAPGSLGDFEHIRRIHQTNDTGVVLAIGYKDLPARWRAWTRVRSAGFAAPALVHPRAYVAASARVGDGCMVMAGSIVDIRVSLGEAVVVWPGACINHDSAIGSNSFVSPNATVCGGVRVGANCFIGAGAGIADGRQVPEGSFIKMLSVYSGRP